MQSWQSSFLGLGAIPRDLSTFELNAFTFDAAERRAIDTCQTQTHKLGLALHIGFLRLSGRHLAPRRIVPAALWSHRGTQISVTAPELASLKAMYAHSRSRRIGGNISPQTSLRRSHQRGWRESLCAASSDSPLTATQNRFCLRKPSRTSSLTHEIDVEWARASAPQNTEQERQRNQVLNRPDPHQCSLPALRIWQQKQMNPDNGHQ